MFCNLLPLAALNKAFIELSLPVIDVIYIDTLKLAVYQLNKQHQVLPTNSATLTVCRQRLDLPSCPEHNALVWVPPTDLNPMPLMTHLPQFSCYSLNLSNLD